MIKVIEATAQEIDALVELEAALFIEDGGRHDPFVDTTWPARAGREDLEDLISSRDGMVLAAFDAGVAVGLLVGYVAKASRTRQPIHYAVLRTMYVAEHVRRQGAAVMLVNRFLDWARARGCVEAHVDHYVANKAAGALYEGCGFEARSTSRSLTL